MNSEKEPNSSGEYFKKHLESPIQSRSAEERARTGLFIRGLNQPIQEIHYSPRGELSVVNRGISISFAYELATLEPDHFDDDDPLKKLPITDWRKLTDLTLHDQAGHQLRLSEILPAGYEVIFLPAAQNYGQTNLLRKEILIIGDLARLIAILGLLHELGHARDYEQSIESEKKVYLNAFDHIEQDGWVAGDLEEILRRERNAWSLALKAIRPFLPKSGDIRNAVRSLIHDFLLTTYSQVIRDKIDQAAAEELEKIAA